MHKLLRQGFLASCKNIPVACCKSLQALSFVSFVLPSTLRQGAGNLCSLQQVSSSSARAVAALLCSGGSALTATSTQLCPAASRGKQPLLLLCWVLALGESTALAAESPSLLLGQEPSSPKVTQGGRFSGTSCSSSRNLILTKIFQAYSFPIWRRAPGCGHSECIYMRAEICAFKSTGCVFMLFDITLHSLYHCRLFTFIGANLSFGRQLCQPARICSFVLCSALSHPWAVWLETHCCL